MKTTTKALMFSVFIFPGTGHWVLKRHKSALVLIISALVLTGILLVKIFSIAWAIAQQIIHGEVAPDVFAMRQQITQQLFESGAIVLNATMIALVLIWVVGIVDVWRLNRRQAV